MKYSNHRKLRDHASHASVYWSFDCVNALLWHETLSTVDRLIEDLLAPASARPVATGACVRSSRAGRVCLIFDTDGAEVQQCGNCVHSIFRYLQTDGSGDTLMLGSRGGTVEARLETGGQISVSLGEPDFAPAALPFRVRRAARTGQVAGDTLPLVGCGLLVNGRHVVAWWRRGVVGAAPGLNVVNGKRPAVDPMSSGMRGSATGSFHRCEFRYTVRRCRRI